MKKTILNLSLISIIFMIFLSGCATKNDTALSKPPSWFLQKDARVDVLVGYGSGDSADSSKSSAINDLISNISVNVESTFRSSQIRENSDFNSSSSMDISMSVDDFGITNIALEKSDFNNGIYYSKIAVKKSDLVAKLRNDITGHSKDISSTFANSRCESINPKEFNKIKNSLDLITLKRFQIKSINGSDFSTPDYTKGMVILDKNSPLPKTKILFYGIDDVYNPLIVKNSLQQEYSKFFSIIKDADGIQSLENMFEFYEHEEGIVKIVLSVALNDCRGNIQFATKVDSSYEKKEATTGFAKAMIRMQVQVR